MKTADRIPSVPHAPVSDRLTAVVLLKYWLPVALWMAVIFAFSGDAGSTRRTSRLIGPILRWLHPNISDATVNDVQFVIRKTAHVTEYAILSLLLWRALHRSKRGDGRPWNWQEAGIALAVAVLFAMGDEWRQSFVRDRQGQLSDMIIDGGGGILGLAGLWTFGRRRGRW